MVVTWAYNAGTNTATASGAGSTNFAALVAADVAGGWGKFTADATGTQIICAGKIVVGDGRNALTWVDTNKQVYFTTVLGTNGFHFEIKAKATVTFGTLSDLTTKQTSDGCSFYTNSSTALIWFMFYVSTNGIFYLYSSTAYDYDTTSSYGGFIRCYGTARYWNCQLNLGLNDAVGDLYNTNFQATSLGRIRIAKCTLTVDKITVQKCNIAFYAYQTYIANVSNSLVRGATHIFQSESTSADSHLTNVDSDVWHFDWVGTSTGKIYRQYTFNLEVYDAAGSAIQNADVLLEQQDGTDAFDVDTDATGAIAEQTVSRGYYAQATGDTLQDYGPFKLTVSKAGYQTYVHDGIVLDEKIDWRIYLHPQLSGDAIAGDVMLGKTFYSNDADTKLTGTYTPTQLMEQRTKIRRVENPVDELLLMYTGMLTIENQKLRRNRIEPKPS